MSELGSTNTKGKDLVRTGFREGYKRYPARIIVILIILSFLIILLMAMIWFTQAESSEDGALVSACGICGTYEHCDAETNKCILNKGRCNTNSDCAFNERCETVIHQCKRVF